MFEFSREEDGNEDLVESTLDVDDGDQAEDSMCDVPQFQIPLNDAHEW